MEVEYLIERLGPYLGGVDIEAVRKALNSRSAVGRLLGIEVEEIDLQALECARLKAFLDFYKGEEERLSTTYKELRSSGISPSDLSALKSKIREIKKKRKLYESMYRLCSSQVSIFTNQASEF